MTFFRSIIIVVCVFGLSLASFMIVLFRLHPYSVPQLSITLFFVSFFFLVSGLATLVGVFTRIIARKKDEEFYNPLNVSLRQGLLIGLCTTGLLGFQALKTLNAWDSFLLVAIIVLIEIYFMARERIS